MWASFRYNIFLFLADLQIVGLQAQSKIYFLVGFRQNNKNWSQICILQKKVVILWPILKFIRIC